jgi:rSAM/selenodomain-associated transferase 1
MSSDRRILLFAKPPVPGHVKTRTIPALGAEGAARLHRQLLMHTAQTLDAYTGAVPELWVGADIDHADFRSEVFQGWQRYPQCGSDLGQRMLHAICSGLSRAPAVVVTGSDCPLMDAAYLDEAFSLLQRHNVVLGPAEDGGYVLIGMKQSLPALFRDIPWGTGGVLSRTRQALRAAGLSWQELPILWDVDRPEDVVRLKRSGVLRPYQIAGDCGCTGGRHSDRRG